MTSKPTPLRPRHKSRPKSRSRLFISAPLPLPQATVRAQWSPQRMPLEELLMDFQLPQLVLCKTPVLRAIGDNGPLPVALEKPILLTDQRTARHLLARIVVFDRRSNSFAESLDSVVIPEDYEGYFVKLHSRTTKDRTHVQSLDGIANDEDIPAFLNLTDVMSYPVEPRNSKSKSHLVYTVGNVFLVEDLYHSGVGSDAGNGNGLQSAISGSSRRSVNGLMRCLDERGVVVDIPTNQGGAMVAVVKNVNGSRRLSVQSKDIIANEKFPLVARYTYGKRPPRLPHFTRLLTLLDSFQETSLVGCILDGARVNLVEIPLTSSLQFLVALNRDELLEVPRLRTILDMSRTQGQDFARDIKYKFKFSHKVQESSPRMKAKPRDEDDFPSATVRTRLIVTETYLYI